MRLKNILFLICIVILTGCSDFSKLQKDPVDYVDVFTGTSNSRWMLSPYASVPYGKMAQATDHTEGPVRAIIHELRRKRRKVHLAIKLSSTKTGGVVSACLEWKNTKQGSV